jgi:hypothetical protein
MLPSFAEFVPVRFWKSDRDVCPYEPAKVAFRCAIERFMALLGVKVGFPWRAIRCQTGAYMSTRTNQCPERKHHSTNLRILNGNCLRLWTFMIHGENRSIEKDHGSGLGWLNCRYWGEDAQAVKNEHIKIPISFEFICSIFL